MTKNAVMIATVPPIFTYQRFRILVAASCSHPAGGRNVGGESMDGCGSFRKECAGKAAAAVFAPTAPTSDFEETPKGII